MKRLRLKKIILIFSVLLLAGMFQENAFASELPDLGRKGSISVTMQDSETKESVSGGILTVYQVGDLWVSDGEVAWKWNSQFNDANVAWMDMPVEEMAKNLKVYIENRQIKGMEVRINNDGVASLENQPIGVYLVVQSVAADGYEAINPFLVTIPMQESEWVYDVDATPKVELKKDKQPIPERDEELPQTGQLNWPIPILAIGGMSLFAFGWMLSFAKGKENSEK